MLYPVSMTPILIQVDLFFPFEKKFTEKTPEQVWQTLKNHDYPFDYPFDYLKKAAKYIGTGFRSK